MLDDIFWNPAFEIQIYIMYCVSVGAMLGYSQQNLAYYSENDRDGRKYLKRTKTLTLDCLSAVFIEVCNNFIQKLEKYKEKIEQAVLVRDEFYKICLKKILAS